MNFTLQVGTVAEKIAVSAEAPLIETTNATVETLVNERSMRELPLNGRSFTNLVAIQPGAYTVTTAAFTARTGGMQGISINGARPSQSLYLLDGVENMNPSANTPLSSVLSQQLGVDAVREYSVLANNFGAQYGRAIGGVVNAATRSGTNEFHGSAWEFFRNSKLDAKNFFDNPTNPIPAFKQNQFGATFGGPIKKDKAFFFLSYEGVRRVNPITDFLRVIGRNARNGIITDANGNVLQVVPVNPAMVPVMEQLSVKPNGPELGGGLAQYSGSRSDRGHENYGMIRVDQNFSDKDSLFVRFTPDSNGHEAQGFVPKYSEFEEGGYDSATIQETHIFSPAVLNNLSGNFIRSSMAGGDRFPPDLDPRVSCQPLDKRFPVCAGFAPAGVGGIIAFSPTFGFHEDDNVFSYHDQITYSAGAHNLRTGAEVKRYQLNEAQLTWPQGVLLINNVTDFIQGRIASVQGVLPQSTNPFVPSDLNRGYRQWFGGLFAQGDFKVRSSVTLNLGLRWERMTDPSEVNGKIGNVRDVLRDSSFTLGKMMNIHDGWKGLAPRFGFAWTPFSNQATVVRGGFGVYKEWPLSYLYLLSNYVPPYADKVLVANPSFPFPLQGVTTGQRDPLVNEFNWTVGYSYQYNFGIERQLGSNYAVRIGFWQNRSTVWQWTEKFMPITSASIVSQL